MQTAEWPYALTIAGFDPSGGAGLLADIKTMEQHRVYGLSVCTAVTVQNDTTFEDVHWCNLDLISQQLNLLFQKFPVKYCKIGLVKNWNYLLAIINLIHQTDSSIKIILDPILKASAGFDFHQTTDRALLSEILKKIFLLTPNLIELKRIGDWLGEEEIEDWLIQHCNLLVKGGHSNTQKGIDYLYYNKEVFSLKPKSITSYQKHGSGCILSAAITANLAVGMNLNVACQKAKNYTLDRLQSNKSRLAYHNQ